tara:strand:+ start:588 stop:767 length:180 start_codon:yes stop_codon:yes gene_type:complete
MVNLEDYKDLMDEIKKMDVREVPISGSTEDDEEVIEDTEYLEWYENWKKENFNYKEKKQ